MSTSSIDAVREVLADLLEPDQPQALIEVLAGDAAAAKDGFPVCIVASDETFVADLSATLPDAFALRPFNEVVEWTKDDRLLLQRAGVLMAGTTARQLLPRTLVDAMTVAAGAGTPIALLVDGIGRTSDPQAASAGAGKQLEAALPKARSVHLCLGDSRFPGPDLAKAAATAIALRAPEGKAHALATVRVERIRVVLAERVDQVRSATQQIGEQAILLRQNENAGEILARATAAAWHQHLAPLREALISIDLDAIVNEVRGNERGVAMIQSALEMLREHVSGTLTSAVSDAEPLMMADLENLAKYLGNDIECSREAFAFLGNPVESSDVDFTDARDKVCQRLDVMVGECLASLEVPTRLLSLAQWFEQSDDRPQADSEVETSNDEVTEMEGENDEEFETVENEPGYDPKKGRAMDRFRHLFARLPEHILAKRLEAALRETLSEADVGVGFAIEAAVATWTEGLRASVGRAYAPFHDVSDQARSDASLRLDTLLAALRAIDLIGGASDQASE